MICHRRFGAIALAMALAGCAAPSPTTPPAIEPEPATVPVERRFADWVTDFARDARAAGIDDATLGAAFAAVQYRPRVVELDRAQPEFTRSVWAYLDATVSPQRVARGQARLAQARGEADAAAARSGVPATVLAAIWGIESDYGAHVGDVPTIDALATLGFDGRRAAWARAELLAALQILQDGDIDRAAMVGSWAGAIGQTQLLPSNYRRYGVDADGDGRRDLRDSIADALASTARLLQHAGWRADEPPLVEVQLPAGYDVGRAEPTLRQSSAQWQTEGLRTADGAPLPPLADAAILLPAGARGPAFLAGANFRAILRYNNSTSYALAVGLLAERIADGPGVRAAWPRDLVPLARNEVQTLQAALNARGFDAGAIDGQPGPQTSAALRRYQRSVGLPADGYPTLELLRRLAPEAGAR